MTAITTQIVQAPKGGWLGDAVKAQIRAGDTQALLRAIATLASAWMNAAGVHPAAYRSVMRSEVAGCQRKSLSPPPDAAQRAFLAAGCDLLDVLALSHEGGQALRDLGFEPVPDSTERKG